MERTWAGTHTFGAEAIHEARSIAEVQDLVAGNPRVRALGTRHSFNDLADGPGILVSTTAIEPDFVLDETARTVTVGGGTRYGVLAEWLERQGWALHNMGSLPHISVAGATATSTHGSGQHERVAVDRGLRPRVRDRRRASCSRFAAATPTSRATSCTSARSASSRA